MRRELRSLFPVLAVCCAGCPATSADLEPARSADGVAGLDDGARATADGVEVVVEAADWPGDAYIAQAVTPLRVTVIATGTEPVRVRYGDFELVGDSGRIYRALPPLAVSGSVDVTPERARELDPGFDYDGFGVAPAYAPAYPGVGIHSGPFVYDPHYTVQYDYWDEVEEELPTPEMIASALPEGVIEPGGYVAGWVYFQKVDDDDETRVWFSADLRTPDDAGVAELRIPFLTD